jgi:hypothetical protein
MIVVRHERIRNKLNGRPITIFAKTSKEESIILRFKEYPLTVVSTIVNMVIVLRKEFHDQHNWVAGRSPSRAKVRFLIEIQLGEKTVFLLGRTSNQKEVLQSKKSVFPESKPGKKTDFYTVQRRRTSTQWKIGRRRGSCL